MKNIFILVRYIALVLLGMGIAAVFEYGKAGVPLVVVSLATFCLSWKANEIANER